MGKASILSQALPFIRRFRDSTVVIKYGGSAMVDEATRENFADDVAMLHYVGIRPVIVHGGGPHISAAMGQRGIEPQFHEGLRITDAETIRVVQSTLVGEINPDIVRLINNHGPVATGVSGLDANLFLAEPHDEALGFVGRVVEVNSAFVEESPGSGLCAGCCSHRKRRRWQDVQRQRRYGSWRTRGQQSELRSLFSSPTWRASIVISATTTASSPRSRPMS